MAKKNIDDLRDLLFATIEGVKEGKIDVDRAKMIGDLSQVMVNSAKVEVEYAKATGQKGSGFLEKADELPPGITGIRQHRIGG
jgi:cell shape-determining protein MreC